MYILFAFKVDTVNPAWRGSVRHPHFFSVNNFPCMTSVTSTQLSILYRRHTLWPGMVEVRDLSDV